MALKLDEKIDELQERIIVLETNYNRDITTILEILKKLEVKMAGDLDSVGLISEVRCIKGEMVDNKIQLGIIEKGMREIKDKFVNNQEFERSFNELRGKVAKHDRNQWIAWGVIAAGIWIITNISSLLKIFGIK